MPADGIKLHFGFDKLATCDILIGADGIHSRVRKMMYESTPECAKPIFSGQYAYRSIHSAEKLKTRAPNNPTRTGFNMVRDLWACDRESTPANIYFSISGAARAGISSPMP